MEGQPPFDGTFVALSAHHNAPIREVEIFGLRTANAASGGQVICCKSDEGARGAHGGGDQLRSGVEEKGKTGQFPHTFGEVSQDDEKDDERPPKDAQQDFLPRVPACVDDGSSPHSQYRGGESLQQGKEEGGRLAELGALIVLEPAEKLSADELGVQQQQNKDAERAHPPKAATVMTGMLTKMVILDMSSANFEDGNPKKREEKKQKVGHIA